MMNIIDFVKEFEFKKRRRLRSWGGGRKYAQGVRIYAQGGAKAQGGAAGQSATEGGGLILSLIFHRMDLLLVH